MAKSLRIRGAGIFLLVIALALVGAQTLTAQAKPIELNYWYAYAGVVQETNEALIKNFNETVGKQKGIHVTGSTQGTYSDIQQKIQAATIAGNPPNVFVLEMGVTGMLAINGIMEPLDSRVAADKLDLGDFQDALIKSCRYNGKLYALPFMPSNLILYMNTTLLKQAGLDPAGPKTWDDLARYCKTVKEKTGLYGLTLASNIWFLEGILLEAGTSVLSSDEKSTNINTKPARDAVKFFRDLKDAGYIRIMASADSAKLMSDVTNQKAAMWFYTTAGITTFMGMGKNAGFTVNTAFMPKLVTYGTSAGGSNIVISSKGSKQEKDAAWEFIKWVSATEQTVFTSSKTGYMPSRKSAIESPTMKALYAALPQFKVAIDQMAYADGRPMNPMYTEASSVITSALDAVWVNGRDIETEFAEAQKAVDKILRE
jgi:sn-glycerol 3-phosphate transport system substrate-binding protein